jgi:hypothetical protein
MTRLQELVEVNPNSIRCYVRSDLKPLRVWLILSHKKPTLPFIPQHKWNAFLEDEWHDWFYRNGQLKLHPKGAKWVLLEFEK